MTDEPYDKPRQPEEASVPWFAIKILFVILVMGIAILTQPSQWERNHSNSTQAENSEISPLKIAKPDTPITAETEAYEQEKQANKIAENGLKAQWVMADIAWLGMFIGGIGIAYIALTLMEARKTTKAAEKSIDVTREMGVKQTRAYIGVESIEILNWAENGTLATRTYFKNFGQTPASSMVFIIDIFTSKTRLPPEYEHPVKHRTPPAQSMLAAGERFYSDTVADNIITKEQFYRMIASYAGYFNIIGQIAYTDVFGTERVTRFRYVYHGGQVAAGEGPATDKGGNTFT